MAGTAGRLALNHLGSIEGLLIANTIGCFILAATTSWVAGTELRHGHLISLFLGTGLCGALTTQSALALATLRPGILIAVVSLFLGAGFAAAGWWAGRVLALPPFPRSS